MSEAQPLFTMLRQIAQPCDIGHIGAVADPAFDGERASQEQRGTGEIRVCQRLADGGRRRPFAVDRDGARIRVGRGV